LLGRSDGAEESTGGGAGITDFLVEVSIQFAWDLMDEEILASPNVALREGEVVNCGVDFSDRGASASLKD
jgi:hypothetical protein